MTEKNVQLKDLQGNLIMPKTKAAVVFNNDGEALGTVEAGAQVNIVDGLTYDGSALTIDAQKKIALPVFSLKKLASTDTGYSADFAAQYQLTKDGVAVGSTINLAKDMVISDGELKYCAEANVPVAGLEVGDPYLELTIANNDGTKIYIPVKGLVDIYTAGDGLDLANGQFSVDTTDSAIQGEIEANSTKFVQAGKIKTALDGKVDKLATKPTAGQYTKVTINAEGQVTAGDNLVAADIPALDSAKITTLSDYVKASAEAAIASTDTLNAALGKLEYKVDNAALSQITGAASTIVKDNLTATKFLVSDANGKVAASTIASDANLLVWEELA